MVTGILFFVGFYILLKGADVLIDGASSLATRWNVSSFVIGIIIVGIGASLPEFSIALSSHILGKDGIAVGTIIGSNIFNILGILGITAFLFPFTVRPEWVWRDMLWNIGAVLIAFAALNSFTGGEAVLSRGEGFLFIVLFFAWLYFVIKKTNHTTEEAPLKLLTLPIALGMILAGGVGIYLGGIWVVEGASAFARFLGVPESVIGLVIVGIGTSLPELTASVVAAYKKQPGIAVGNIIGSNIFDFLAIFGTAALIRPLMFDRALFADLIVLVGAAALLFFAMFVGKKYELMRWQGGVFILLYVLYLLYLLSARI